METYFTILIAWDTLREQLMISTSWGAIDGMAEIPIGVDIDNALAVGVWVL